MKHRIRTPLFLCMAVAGMLSVTGLVQAASDDASATPPQAIHSDRSAASRNASNAARSWAKQERDRIVQEAISALAHTNEALRALDAGDTAKAMDALAIAVGKLELVVAMDPKASLAPVDVRMITLDLVTTPKAVRKAVDEAEDLLEDGRIQQARAILRDLGSEIIVRVTNIPLATYPDAIKAVVPLIKQGKLKEAKMALEDALGTLVVVDHVIPLPWIRAEALLKEAKELAVKPDRSEEEQKRLVRLLDQAREQLELGRSLGYGDKKDYEPFFKTISEIERKTAEKGTEKGLFDQLKQRFEALRERL